jgi:DNA-binding PadR family transcriptional regulator
MVKRKLSEIEACVLALAWANGPSTPYAIRRVFLKSPTPQWSGSAGTIYPLIERLLKEKLIHSRTLATGKREAQQIYPAAAGMRALKQWMAIPTSDWVAGAPPDPLRTRVRFLGLLPKTDQKAFVLSAWDQVHVQLLAVEEDCATPNAAGPFYDLMARGALLTMQSRCRFLEEVADAVGVALPKSRSKRTA